MVPTVPIVPEVPVVQNVQAAQRVSFKVQGFKSSRLSRPAFVFRPHFRWRRYHGAAGGGLDDGAFRRAVHQAHGTAGIGAALVDLQKMLRCRCDNDCVDFNFAAGDIAHAAFGTFTMIDLKFWRCHLVYYQTNWKRLGLGVPKVPEVPIVQAVQYVSFKVGDGNVELLNLERMLS